ncbi:Transposon Tf2-6 polyprotein [Trichinella nelsoni]|uniref:Transposon Tf2-6 polyprotein n=1 Tax=Trichinella nelsoni TaxID=6336 RepID=A0A0V0S720_9BILA|nr:Transposon Tf2-6 polyprotein [Trichinella nelsoni]
MKGTKSVLLSTVHSTGCLPFTKKDSVVQTIAKYRVFSTTDLKSAYHQIPILDEEKLYMACEADGSLYQFTSIPFGVTNGVACFQSVVAYLDDVTVCGLSQDDHDKNLEQFLSAAKKWNFTFNTAKYSFLTSKLRILGHEIENGEIRPGPQRLQPLRDLPFTIGYESSPASPSLTLKLCRYHWKPKQRSNLYETLHFDLETNASGVVIAAVLNQQGRSVAFFSRALQGPKKRYAVIEKEAQAIIEAIRHWKHYLRGRAFHYKNGQEVSKLYVQKKTITSEIVGHSFVDISGLC